MNPLYEAFIMEVPSLGGLSSGFGGKSSVYTPFRLYWSASLNGVAGGEYEIPLIAALCFPLITIGGLLSNK